MLLGTYPEPMVVDAILGIAEFGARIGYTGHCDCIQVYPNLATVEGFPEIIATGIKVELKHNRLECHTSLTSLPSHFTASPLGLADKSDGSKRRIHHLLYPTDMQGSGSVHGEIPEDYGEFTYSSITEAITAAQRYGKGSHLVKREFASAFQHIPVSPLDCALLGFHWWNKYYIERFLPPDQNLEAYTQRFTYLCELVGLAIKEVKNEEGIVGSSGGIELDTENIVIRLPTKKLVKARTLVESALNPTSLSLHELKKITGYMNFASVVIPLGWNFLRCLYNMQLYFLDQEGNGRHSCRRKSKDVTTLRRIATVTCLHGQRVYQEITIVSLVRYTRYTSIDLKSSYKKSMSRQQRIPSLGLSKVTVGTEGYSLHRVILWRMNSTKHKQTLEMLHRAPQRSYWPLNRLRKRFQA